MGSSSQTTWQDLEVPSHPGPVESAVRREIRAGAALATPSQGKPFSVEAIDESGVVLLLGAGQFRTRLSWSCLEGIPDFLRGRGWVPVGGVYDTTGSPGTLDAYLKGWVRRATAGWVAVLLEAAGVVELDRRRPTRVRLTAGH